MIMAEGTRDGVLSFHPVGTNTRLGGYFDVSLGTRTSRSARGNDSKSRALKVNTTASLAVLADPLVNLKFRLQLQEPTVQVVDDPAKFPHVVSQDHGKS